MPDAWRTWRREGGGLARFVAVVRRPEVDALVFSYGLERGVQRLAAGRPVAREHAEQLAPRARRVVAAPAGARDLQVGFVDEQQAPVEPLGVQRQAVEPGQGRQQPSRRLQVARRPAGKPRRRVQPDPALQGQRNRRRAGRQCLAGADELDGPDPGPGGPDEALVGRHHAAGPGLDLLAPAEQLLRMRGQLDVAGHRGRDGSDPRVDLVGDVVARAAFDQRTRPHAAQRRARQRLGHGGQRLPAGRLLAQRFLTHRFSVGRPSAGRLFAVRHLAGRHLARRFSAGRFSAGCFSAGRFPDAEHQAPRPRPQQVLEARHHDAAAALHQEDVDAAPFDEPGDVLARDAEERVAAARRLAERRGELGKPTPRGLGRPATGRRRGAAALRLAERRGGRGARHRGTGRGRHGASTGAHELAGSASRSGMERVIGARFAGVMGINRRARAGGTGRRGRRTARRGCRAAPPRRHRERRSGRSCGWC